ncbi:uncharacterized protein LOC124262459 [Haliotis rubra]|uniref:uncharacterized protein LOC124262459 n=1 Tax=Haliotis rubra TaxID=36100 RepID=UPI001EE58BC9|nr:uncharacterized protein LOC124262459 [Haliotis rubra]XP_046552923.1 uncharacterized protein LOC124262459 [Haliotis rubra]XP_046552924.1 uncharacterized protein LOC124262459 [Haliotis rubra]
MLLSIPELVFTLSCILMQGGRLHVKAENIMLNKLSILSTTYTSYPNHGGSGGVAYHSPYANDGSQNNWPARSNYQKGPFWQGDLQGFYIVHNISVISDTFGYAPELRGAYIGVSSVDVGCPDDDVIWCGQWPPDTLTGVTLTFNCTHEQPVRFVRVWRNITGYLAVQEVEVEGTPRRKNAAKYDKSLNKKLTTPATSVKAISANDCGIQCHKTQPCLGFSYNPSGDPPCLLAPSTATTTATGWVSYAISTCSHNITCDLTDQFK